MRDNLFNIITGMAAAVLLAAPAGAYTDDAQIRHPEAVETLTEAGILSGQPDGSFSPAAAVTRGEFAKIVSLLADPDAARAPSAGFTDTPGTWAEAYIDHCYALGLTGGVSPTEYAPAQPVTPLAAANMLLPLVGGEHYSGSTWAARTQSAAQEWGLFTDLDGLDLTAPLSREDAAQMVYNAALSRSGVWAMNGLDPMSRPNGLCINGDGGVLFTDLQYGAVWRVSGGEAQVLAELETPWGIAPFLGGWAVSSRDSNTLYVVFPNGGIQTINGHSAENLPKSDKGVTYNLPTGLASDTEGNLYVSDTGSGAVRKITSTGEVTTVAKNLDTPTGLCWAGGVLYAAETGKDRIVRITDGKIEAVAVDTEFSLPQGVLADDKGVLYVADTGNARVCRVENGKAEELPFGDILASPVGMALYENRLYVCDSFMRQVYRTEVE